MTEKQRAMRVIKLLENEYPDFKPPLDFADPLQIMVATILAAQCTDKRVNMITPSLFKKYPTAKAYAKADLKTFEQEIRSTGFYRNKAKNIIAAAKMIEKDFNGKVPDNMTDLLKLPGVARKTANIILSYGFGVIEGIAVDTHVGRLSQRLGLTNNKDPNKIERDLLELLPKKEWFKINFLLISHGRAVCVSRKPRCPDCVVQKLCPSAHEFLDKYYS